MMTLERGLLYLAASTLLATSAVGCGAATPPVEEPSAGDRGPPSYGLALRLEDAGTTPDDTPHTQVTLVSIEPDGASELAALEVEPGACWHDTDPPEGVLIAVRCWWAGAGARYQVTRHGDQIIARRLAVDEQAGEAEWVEAGRIEIPANATLQVLRPGRQVELPAEGP